VVICAKTAEPSDSVQPTEIPYGLWTRMGPRNHVLDGGPDTHVKGQLLGERTCPGMPINSLSSAVQKIAESQRKHKFNRICQVVPMCPHVRGTFAQPGEYD